MKHICHFYKDIREEVWWGRCSCKALFGPVDLIFMRERIKNHLNEVKDSVLREHNGRITDELVQSFIESGVKPPSFRDILPEECPLCDEDPNRALHVGSPLCKAGGVGVGGTIAHCYCKACYGMDDS